MSEISLKITQYAGRVGGVGEHDCHLVIVVIR